MYEFKRNRLEVTERKFKAIKLSRLAKKGSEEKIAPGSILTRKCATNAAKYQISYFELRALICMQFNA